MKLFVCVITCLLVFPLVFLLAETKQIVLGENDGWRDIQSAENITFKDGKRGFLDAVLSDGGPIPDGETDLLINFDTSSHDVKGNYLLVTKQTETHENAARRGAGGGVFAGTTEGVVYKPLGDAALSANRSWDDLTIEFWLYPVLLDEGATILQWTGARRQGNSVLFEDIHVYFSNRRLVWKFVNTFLPPDLSQFSIRLEGNDVLVPRRWHHHLMRYSGDTGLLEYLVDGVFVDIRHTTGSGKESTEVYAPYTGDSRDSYLSLGAGFTGFIDELRIHTSNVENPALARYPDGMSIMTTRVFDLDYTNTRLVSIDADFTEASESALLFYYRIGEFLTSARSISEEWVPFDPSTGFAENERGRYLQVRVVLLPDGEREVSPELHSITIRYEPDLPPHPPENIRATAGDGEISVSWKRSLDADVAGYLVYYGNQTMWYFGNDSAEGNSPIDVGDADSFTLSGLTNGSLYYIAVVAYDSGSPPHQSEFSLEKSARPTRTFGNR